MNIDLRNGRLQTIFLGATIFGAAALMAARTDAGASAIAAVTTVSCSVTGANWCISGNNTSSGIGVIGTSKTGTGLRGTSTSQYGLKATSVTGTAILAQSTSGNTGISASSANGEGVLGFTTSDGIGVYGYSPSGFGVYGTTTAGTGYGVAGLAFASGVGSYGFSSTGSGVEAFANTGIGLNAQTTSSNSNPAVYAHNFAGNAGDFGGTYIGLIGRAPASGFPLVATNSDGSANLFWVDGAGNVAYRGGLSHFTSVKSGATVKSFTPTSAAPTVEDTGTAQLVGGAAAVRLDPTFAESIDTTAAYRVFVTPNGDTRGLFVATKSPAGFLVRESAGGRSSITFDYRIVALAAGQAGQRMARVTASASSAAPVTAAPNVAAPHILKPAAPSLSAARLP
jgi:hypothetical protein